MPDQFGAIEFPVARQASEKEAVTDPGLTRLGNYLKAVLNAELGSAWDSVNVKSPFVKLVDTNMPDDSTFNERDLPGLFLERASNVDEQITDDFVQTTTQVTVLWVAVNAVQAKRSIRSPGLNGFHKSIARALYLGRHPAWIDSGDDDPTAAEFGSVLVARMRLNRWPSVVRSNYTNLTILKGDTKATYVGFSLTIAISEMTEWDVAPNNGDAASASHPAENAPSKVEIDSTSGALELVSIIPPT